MVWRKDEDSRGRVIRNVCVRDRPREGSQVIKVPEYPP